MVKAATLGQKALVEAVGVFFLVFIGAGAVIAAQYANLGGTALIAIAFANGIALALAVTFALNISGGHINPAITTAMWLNGFMKSRDAVVYVVAQLIGAVVAGLVLLAIYPAASGIAVNYGTTSLSASTGALQGIAFEAVLTFVLAFTVMGTIVGKRSQPIAGFGPGLAVFIDVLAGGAFTGAAMNPVRWFGPAIASGFFANWYVYIIGPIVGAAVAVALYKYLVMR